MQVLLRLKEPIDESNKTVIKARMERVQYMTSKFQTVERNNHDFDIHVDNILSVEYIGYTYSVLISNIIADGDLSDAWYVEPQNGLQTSRQSLITRSSGEYQLTFTRPQRLPVEEERDYITEVLQDYIAFDFNDAVEITKLEFDYDLVSSKTK